MEQQSVWSLIREDLEAYEKIGEKGFFKVFLKQYFKTPGFRGGDVRKHLCERIGVV